MDWNNPLIYIIPGLAALSGAIYLARWIGGKDEFAKTVGKSIDEIRDDIKKIFHLMSADRTVEIGSPLRLTELGQSISANLEAAAWAKRTAEEIAHEIEDKQPYVIQTYCFNFVRKSEMLSAELTRKIQESAYNNGITVARVEEVLAIELRDALLKIHGLEPPKSN